MRIPMKQVGLTAVAAGFAATAAVGAWGSWNTTDNDEQSTEVGVLDLDLGVSGSTAFSSALGTESNPLVPGDSGCRVIHVVNDGTIDFEDFSMWVDDSALVDDGATTETGDAGADNPDTDTDGRADLKDYLSIRVDSKATTITGATCADKLTAAATAEVAETDLADIDSSGENDNIGDGTFAAPNTRGSITEKYLLVSYAVASDAPASVEGIHGDITFNFDADQRTATTDR